MSSKVAGLRNIVSVVVLFVATQCSVVPHSDVDIDQEEYSLTIRMPDVVSDRADDLVCTGVKLDPAEAYLIRFKPHAKKETAHHMMVYGCHQPASHDASWHCFNTDNLDENGVCGDGERQVLFAWAMDAPDKSLPEGVGIRVSGQTNIKYLVIQLHYATAFRPGITDNSGITIDFTKKRPEQIANYLVLGNFGSIPPKQKDLKITTSYSKPKPTIERRGMAAGRVQTSLIIGATVQSAYHKTRQHSNRRKLARTLIQSTFYMESSCVFGQTFTIYPIGYRTHSHNLGYVTSGYRIRDGKWTEIGRMSPQLPQTFYPVTNPGMDIRNGDVLVSRCTMNSMARAEVTNIGPTNHDEMCNFYIMYSTFNPEQQPTNYCFKDANNYTWAVDETVDLSDIPDNLSSLEGIPRAETVEKYFKSGAQEHHPKG